MTVLDTILQKALAEREYLTRAELVQLLSCTQKQELEALFAAAYAMKLRHVGAVVYLRGLVEVGNLCRKNCLYCGIRRDNHTLHRFTLQQTEILHAAALCQNFHYGSLVLQAGERTDSVWCDFITDTVQKIKVQSQGKLGITLSLGEQSESVYRQWFEAGAHRYLLRIESSDPGFYRTLHPNDATHAFAPRLEALHTLRRCGYQVGTGVMCALPGQTLEHLAADIEFFRALDVDMIGMGPYLPHHDTPLGQTVLTAHAFNPEYALQLGLKMIAATRLYLRDVNIASTTALQSLAPATGREAGLRAGANIIMPNVAEVVHRADYLLYDGKIGIDENAVETRSKLEQSIAAIGERIGYDAWGDSPHAATHA